MTAETFDLFAGEKARDAGTSQAAVRLLQQLHALTTPKIAAAVELIALERLRCICVVLEEVFHVGKVYGTIAVLIGNFVNFYRVWFFAFWLETFNSKERQISPNYG